MNEWSLWEISKQAEKAASALDKNGFKVTICKTSDDAADKILQEAGDAETVGFGGSLTAVELGLPKRFSDAGKECLIHGAPGLTLEERVEIMRRQLTCDLFITGTNAVTLDGKLVNIDATGNRVGAMAFGPKKVVVAVGANKLTGDEKAAVQRIRDQVAPPNARRLSMQTPCAETGFCSDCNSPQRICRIVHVMEKCPRLTDIHVFLIEDCLGM